MSNEHFQPMTDLKPMAEQGKEDNIEETNPARLDYMEGREFLRKNEYAQAAISFHNALQGFEEQNDQVGVANASDRLGDACLGRGEFAMALANFQRAYTVCLSEEDSFSQLSLNKKMVLCHRNLGDMASALELLDDMLEHYRVTRNPKGAVETLKIMAEVYISMEDKNKAADAYRSAAGIHAHFGHKRHAEELNQMAEQLLAEK